MTSLGEVVWERLICLNGSYLCDFPKFQQRKKNIKKEKKTGEKNPLCRSLHISGIFKFSLIMRPPVVPWYKGWCHVAHLGCLNLNPTPAWWKVSDFAQWNGRMQTIYTARQCLITGERVVGYLRSLKQLKCHVTSREKLEMTHVPLGIEELYGKTILVWVVPRATQCYFCIFTTSDMMLQLALRDFFSPATALNGRQWRGTGPLRPLAFHIGGDSC